MTAYDSIIIGAGHNGLVCAAYLAKSGQRVLVLEASDVPGGMAADHEFHPGFRAPVAHSIGHFPALITADLRLDRHGHAPAGRPMPLVALSQGHGPVVVSGTDITGAGPADADAWRRYSDLMQGFSAVLEPFWQKTAPRIGSGDLGDILTFVRMAVGLRRLGRDDMREFLRIFSLPMRDLLDEYFECEHLKAALSWDGLIGSRMAPRSPNSSVLALLYRMSGMSRGRHIVPAGGVGGLVGALARSAESFGVEVRYEAEVDRILIDGNNTGLRASGVRLSGGEKIAAHNVVSSADPKRTFIDLAGVEYLDIGFTNRIRRLRCDGLVGKLHLALDDLPDFDGLDTPDGRMIVAPTMDAIEFAWDDAKYGNCSQQPVLEIVIPSLHDASLAPDGRHLLSAHVMYVPHKLEGGWSDAARTAIRERAIDAIDGCAPGLRELIVAKEFLTPADIAARHRVTGGHWHHTEFALDQLLMMRPTYEAAQYCTPIPGLYLCGAGCHPGGDLTGLPGHNAAQAILR